MKRSPRCATGPGTGTPRPALKRQRPGGAALQFNDTTPAALADLPTLRGARAEALLRWLTVLRAEGGDIDDGAYIMLKGRGYSRSHVDRAIADLCELGLAHIEVSAGWLTLRATAEGLALAAELRAAAEVAP